MRTWIIALGLFLFCFIIPLQFFVIGNDYGYGVQGAVYRYQITSYGNSFIPITRELTYVTGGIYTGKTALSVILWAAGTLVLVLTTVVSLILWNRVPLRTLPLIITGLIVSGVFYLGSCIAQYGPLLNGSAGISLPFGGIYLVIFAGIIWIYQKHFVWV